MRGPAILNNVRETLEICMKDLLTARDHFRHVAMIAPDFEDDDMNLNSAFIALVRQLTGLSALATDAKHKLDLERALSMVKRAYECFRANDERNGRVSLATALQVFEKVADDWLAKPATVSVANSTSRIQKLRG